MKQSLTEVIFILDRSGSMSGLEDDTIGGYNLLKNDGHIPYDQQAHTDYADRSP